MEKKMAKGLGKRKENIILTALLAVFAAGFCIAQPGLLSVKTLQSICLQFPEIGILTLGVISANGSAPSSVWVIMPI